MKKLICVLIPSLLISGCVPAIVGGGAATVTTAAKEKGISGSLSDTQISTAIKAKLYAKDPEIHKRVGINVQNSEVLLTGSLSTQKDIQDVEKMIWSVQGVTKVINELGVNPNDDLKVGEAVTDGWITTQLKSSLLFHGDIKSINYSLKTVSGVVHLMGIAQSQEELDKVVKIASSTRGVKKVVSNVKIKKATAES